jgi:methyltransferase-like protein/SAM-dependent methyltransferase
MPEASDTRDGPSAGSETSSSYDAVPYSVHAFAQTRPDRLATVGSLFGMNPAPVDRCRVLELGCASGGNLIPMALGWPESQFVGIDLSQRQIDDAECARRRLGLSNLHFQCLSILDVTAELGSFDYILCHGVYSWVPPAVQDKLLAICHDHLNPNGIAYVSYNTFPGWHARAAIREMLCYHTERFEDPADRIREARGLLAFLASSVTSHEIPYNILIRQEVAVLSRTPDTYLLHEHLEEFNEPLYFHQFIDRAAGKHLQYLAEASISSMLPSRLGAEIEQTLRRISADLIHMEQYIDFLRNRMFRQTLLCHDQVKLDYNLHAEKLKTMFIASPAKPLSPSPDSDSGEIEKFAAAPDSPALSTRDPLMKSAMILLSKRWPEPISFAELISLLSARRAIAADEEDQLANRLLRCYTSSSLIELSTAPPRFTVRISDRPIASPYARLRAAEGDRVVNMKLETVGLPSAGRLVLQHMDGTNDRAALVALLQDALANAARKSSSEDSTSPAPDSGEIIDQLLEAFAQGALLVG